MREQAIKELVYYGQRTGLIEAGDCTWATNALLEAQALQLDAREEP